jgi:hypothetical protein
LSESGALQIFSGNGRLRATFLEACFAETAALMKIPKSTGKFDTNSLTPNVGSPLLAGDKEATTHHAEDVSVHLTGIYHININCTNFEGCRIDINGLRIVFDATTKKERTTHDSGYSSYCYFDRRY